MGWFSTGKKKAKKYYRKAKKYGRKGKKFGKRFGKKVFKKNPYGRVAYEAYRVGRYGPKDPIRRFKRTQNKITKYGSKVRDKITKSRGKSQSSPNRRRSRGNYYYYRGKRIYRK